MVIIENIKHGEFACPHCRGGSFVYVGIQRQKGIFNGHELWSCKKCQGTFARESIEVKKSTESELFDKRAFGCYCKVQFAK